MSWELKPDAEYSFALPLQCSRFLPPRQHDCYGNRGNRNWPEPQQDVDSSEWRSSQNRRSMLRAHLFEDCRVTVAFQQGVGDFLFQSDFPLALHMGAFRQHFTAPAVAVHVGCNRLYSYRIVIRRK